MVIGVFGKPRCINGVPKYRVTHKKTGTFEKPQQKLKKLKKKKFIDRN